MIFPRIALAPVGLVVAGLACSSGAAPPPLDGGHTSGDSGHGGSGSGSGSSDSGPSAFYSPTGCSYTVSPAASQGYTALALDDGTSAGAASTATPLRVRLGLGGDVTEGKPGYADPTTTAVLTWETTGANHAAKVRFGTSAGSMGTVQTGYVWTLPPVSTLGGSPTYMHEVHVCGLTPATTYYYQVGGGASGSEIWSATQTFTTIASSGSVTVGIGGDSRNSSMVWQVANEHMKAKNIDAMLFTGDLTLLGDAETDYVNFLDAIWQTADGGPFLTLGQTLFLTVAGNHEYEGDTGASAGPTYAQWLSAFAMPGSGPYAKSFGSFNLGTGHFIYIEDNELANLPAGSDNPQVDAQLAWLKADLMAANADRTKHPFVFVMNHRGLFSTSYHAADPDVLQARSTLAPIFAQYKVDAVFNGHDHEYERTVPIVPGSPVTGDPTPMTGGTTYVICAGVGAQPYAVGQGTQSWRAVKVPFGSAATAPDAAAEAAYLGVYQTLTLSGTQAVLTAYGLTSAGPDPVIDTVTLSH
jgi:3',5'-cyclic AMP phosphodiesterase CpdA